jgi:hypothetical protein
MIDVDFTDRATGPLPTPHREGTLVFDAASPLAIRDPIDGRGAIALGEEEVMIDLEQPASVVVLEVYQSESHGLSIEGLGAGGEVVARQRPIRSAAWIPYPLASRAQAIRRVRIFGGDGTPALGRVAAFPWRTTE